MSTDATQRITADQAGCWLDGHYGWHNTYRVIRIALDYGFVLDAEGEAYVRGYENTACDATGPGFEDAPWEGDGVNYEIVYDISSEAVDYLNTLAPEGYWFVFDDGFYLAKDDDDV